VALSALRFVGVARVGPTCRVTRQTKYPEPSGWSVPRSPFKSHAEPTPAGAWTASHERIYQHVWKDKKDGGTLYLHLRHSGKKYNKRKGKNSGRGLIPNRVDIDQRPSVVAAKSRIGDWEAGGATVPSGNGAGKATTTLSVSVFLLIAGHHATSWARRARGDRPYF